MLSIQTQKQLKDLENAIRADKLTPSKEVDLYSFVCVIQYANNVPIIYTQTLVESLVKNDSRWKEALVGRKVGEVIGDIKVVAVFDVW